MKSLFCVLFICVFAASATENEYSEIDDWFNLNFTNVELARKKILMASALNPDLIGPAETLMKPQTDKLAQWNSSKNTFQFSPGMVQGRFWNNQCRRDLIRIVMSMKSSWFVQMVDSFGKPRSGLLQGEAKWVGNYDECLKVNVPGDGEHLAFRGRYAWVTFHPKSKSKTAQLLGSISVGACFPSSCAEDDNFDELYSSVVTFLEKIPFIRKLVVKLPAISVKFVPGTKPLDAASIVCICICAVFTVLVLLGTFVDVMRRTRKPESKTAKHELGTENDVHRINVTCQNETSSDDVKLVPKENNSQKMCVGQEFLMCFSAISNTEAILDTSASKGQLQCVHGMRVISMAWVILGHTYVFGSALFGNLLDVIQVFDTWPFQVVVQGTYSVDTFFLMSGCLLTYLFIKNENSMRGYKKWISFYVHRYVRLTPVYAMVLFVFGTWWNSMSASPFWTVENADKCSRRWWWNLLYISNFNSVNDMCMGWSWYLANDMQFFVISPLFLLALRRDRMVGLILVGVLLAASWMTTGILSRINKFPIMFEGMGDTTDVAATQEQQWSLFDKIYDKPYVRIGPYLIGVVLGYVLSEVKDNKKLLNKWLVLLGWAGSQALSLILLYGLYKANLGPDTNSAINTLGRSCWAISVAWVIFACITGNAGPVNSLLSWKVWIPLSRLTYCTYLVHPLVMYWFYNSLKTTVYFSNSLIVINYLSFVVLAYCVAFLTSLLFEAPVMKLEKFLKRF